MNAIKERIIGAVTVMNDDAAALAQEIYERPELRILMDASRNVNAEMQCATYDHEMKHINSRDYDYIFTVSDLEAIRHVV